MKSLFLIKRFAYLGFISTCAYAVNVDDIRVKAVYEQAQAVFVSSDSLLKRFDAVVPVYQESITNFKVANAGFLPLTESALNSYANLKKTYESLPDEVIKKIEFKPVAKFIASLFTVFESFVPVSLYLDQGQRLLMATKKVVATVTPRITSELIKTEKILTDTRGEKQKLEVVVAKLRDTLEKLRKAVDLLDVAEKALQPVAGVKLPADAAQKRDAALKAKNDLLTEISTTLKEAQDALLKAEVILKNVEETSQSTKNISNSLVTFQQEMQKNLDTYRVTATKIVDEYVSLAKEYVKTIDGYTSWLNKGTLGIVPGILEIDTINTKEKSIKPLPVFNNKVIEAYENFAKAFAIKAEASKLSVNYVQDATFLKAQAAGYAQDIAYLTAQAVLAKALLADLVAEARDYSSRAKGIIQEDLEVLKKIQPTDVTMSGKLWQTYPFENFRIYDIQSGAARCFAHYISLPTFSLDLGVVKFSSMSSFDSNCSLMTIGDLKDAVVSNDFGASRRIIPGHIFKTKLSFTDRFIAQITTIPLLNNLFKEGSVPVVGTIMVTPGAKGGLQLLSLIGTSLEAAFTREIEIPKVGVVKLTSVGLSIVPGIVPKTAKVMIPVKGTLDFPLSDSFKPTFDVAMVFDTQALAGTLSGIWKGQWKDPFGLKGFAFSDPGVSITVGAKGITGIGMTAQTEFAGKVVKVAGTADLAQPQEIGFIGSLEGGISLKDIVDLHIRMAQQAGVAPISMDDVKKFLPDLSLRDCKIAFMPKVMTLFGKTYFKGITVSGKAQFLGKACEVFLNVTSKGIYGTLELDPLDFKVVKIQGLTQPKLQFAVSIDKNSLGGLACDAQVSLTSPPFEGVKTQGKVFVVPGFIRIQDLSVSLFGALKFALTLEVGIDWNAVPKNLASLPWKVKATMTTAGRESLAQSLKNAFDGMQSCFKN